MDFLSSVEEVVLKGSGKQLSKRDVKLADGTDACRCVLWESTLMK